VFCQDPHNLSSRDLSKFDYLSTGKSAGVVKDDSRLSGINVGASGSAAKILQQIAAKVRSVFLLTRGIISAFVELTHLVHVRLITLEHSRYTGRADSVDINNCCCAEGEEDRNHRPKAR
jgi:hypothetical protein